MRLETLPTTQRARELLHEIASRRPARLVPPGDGPFALYGGGDLGRMAKAVFDDLRLEIDFVVDQRAETLRENPLFHGLPIYRPDEVPSEALESHLLVVSVANHPYSEIATSLRSQGWTRVVPFYDFVDSHPGAHPLANGWMTGQLGARDLEEMEAVSARWEDDLSRAQFIQFVAWHALREDWVFEGAEPRTDDRFFIPEITALLHGEETLVDLGAHHAKVLKKFLETVEYRFDEIYAFEPDRANYRMLEAEIQIPALAGEHSRVHLFDCAIAGEAGEGRFFASGGYYSQLHEKGSQKVEVHRLDDFGLEPTLLKLHLEGAELEALKSGEKTIRRHRPIIVATAYHNAQGLWQLPAWLMGALSEYKFLWRLHSWCGTGAVIYCIPAERTRVAVFGGKLAVRHEDGAK